MNELTKSLRCIVMRNGIEVWIEDEKLENLKKVLLSSDKHSFIEVEGKILNTADISGVFSPQDLEEMTRRKNGDWKCKFDNWHAKRERCQCNAENDLARVSRGF